MLHSIPSPNHWLCGQRARRWELNIQGVFDQTGRLIEDVHRQARDYLASNSDTEEPTAGQLWNKASPGLEKALAVYDTKESPDTPDSSWIPGRTTKASCEKDLDSILDTVLAVLETCGAAGYRTRIRNLQSDIAVSQDRVAKYREQLLSAPEEDSQDFVAGLIVSSKEALRDQIADENDRIAGKTQQLENLKIGFREHLQLIGISVSPETADSFLLPVEDDVVSMAAVISNIGQLTKQLQNLVDQSKEAQAQTKRYYGMYVLLVFAVDRIQNHYVTQIDETFIPKLHGFEQEAARNMSDAKTQMSRGGPKEQLTANIAAGSKTIDACRLMIEILVSHKRSVLNENRKVRILTAAAVNSYRTIRLSSDVADLIGRCEAAFRALRELRLPPLRPFQNVQLNTELQRLAERMIEKE
jgi:hypothetical protein